MKTSATLIRRGSISATKTTGRTRSKHKSCNRRQSRANTLRPLQIPPRKLNTGRIVVLLLFCAGAAGIGPALEFVRTERFPAQSRETVVHWSETGQVIIMGEDSIEQHLRAEFDQIFRTAYGDFRKQVLAKTKEAQKSLSPLREALRAELQPVFYELDGYAGRLESDKAGLLLRAVRDASAGPVYQVRRELDSHNEEAWRALCSLFGVEAPPPATGSAGFPGPEVEEHCRTSAQDIDDSLLSKMIDDGLEFVPFVGWAVAFGKIAYDPGINSRVEKPATALAATTNKAALQYIQHSSSNFTDESAVRRTLEAVINFPAKAGAIHRELACNENL